MDNSRKYEEICADISPEINKIKLSLTAAVKNCPFINNDLEELFSAPTKLIRSVLCLLYLKSNNSEITEKHIQLLTAVELVHNASLIHDDTIDDSEIRRSVKTLNSKFSPKLAVLAGDYVLSVAMQKIIALGNPKITLNFAKTLQNMTEAELIQYFGRFKIPDINEYIEKSKNKTALLFVTAISSCLILSEIEDKSAENFALNFGIAFQIRDDLRNVISWDDKKPAQNDFESGIYTAPAIYANGTNIDSPAIEKTKDLLNNYLKEAFYSIKGSNNAEKLSALIRILKDE